MVKRGGILPSVRGHNEEKRTTTGLVVVLFLIHAEFICDPDF